MRFAGTQLTNFIDPTNFDAIGKSSINGQSLQNRASMISEAYVDRADIKALADIESAKFGASATRAQGEAQGQASMWGGLSKGIGSLAVGFANMPGAGAAPKGQPIPTNMQPLNGTPSYLSPNSSPISLENYGSVLDQW